MSIRLKNIIEELRVRIIYEDCLETDGHYIAAINTIVINNSLNDYQKSKVLLHELGHAAMHQDNYRLYKLTFALHSKMESQADNYMIDNFIEENDNQFNYSMIMEEFNIGIGYDTRYQSFTKIES
ncbi:ImmA/IrrE family metallo-endopeptidase [Vagococcus fluvialis]|uniref:ImmA/IrrE family metallo-endopeptidase n=1 Tax=Vagococcus fluvialis TaxID=2738 RepID=UPI003795F018